MKERGGEREGGREGERERGGEGGSILVLSRVTLPERKSADEHLPKKSRGLRCQNRRVLTNI